MMVIGIYEMAFQTSDATGIDDIPMGDVIKFELGKCKLIVAMDEEVCSTWEDLLKKWFADTIRDVHGVHLKALAKVQFDGSNFNSPEAFSPTWISEEYNI
ncbi:hypothetical protein L6452_40187 [Arctium lappa]|uniref:Uncharacterized protein n=1 Tax=Arctium lappa TaxID=4217 RepID=A0ACB8XLG0_ARCLA|nr:hypothetical protein L6452_40187 [Arctium lappa]